MILKRRVALDGVQLDELDERGYRYYVQFTVTP